MASLISCQNINFHIGEHHLLKDISFELPETNNPDHLVIFGPNGAGKTLLMQLISGNLEPTTGDIKIFGKSLLAKDAHETKKTIGFVSPKLFDDYAYETKVTDVVMSGLFGSIGICQDPTKQSNQIVKQYIAKVVSEKYQGHDRALKALAEMHIQHLAHEEFGHLSYGQKSRVLIARALIAQPKLLILDEPTTGLDLNIRAEFSGLTKALSQKTTIIYITHYIEEILPEFNNLLYIKNGAIYKYGAKEDLLSSNYLTDLLEVPVTIHQQDQKYFAMF